MNGRRILADFKVTARGYLRNSAALFFSLIFPIILIGLFGLIFSSGGAAPTLYVINEDPGGNSTAQFLAYLNETGAVSIAYPPSSVSPQNFSSWLASGQDSAGLVIPAGFSHRLALHEPLNLTLYLNPGSPSAAGAAEAAVEDGIGFLNLRSAGGVPLVGVATGQIGGHDYGYIDYLVPGLIGFSILTSPMFAMVEVVATYRKEGLFRQLSLTPLTRAEWLTSKVLWYTGLTFASAAVMIGFGVGVFGSKVMISWEILPFLFVGPFLFVSLGMLSGSVARTPETAAIFGNIITFPMMFLSGTFFPVQSFPPYLQTVAHLLPLYYVIDGLEAVMLYGNTLRALSDLAVVLVLAVLIFIGAVLAFKWREE